jgi:hypothetical protein
MCDVSDWSEWSPCSHPCMPPAGGETPFQWRERQVLSRQPGAECPNLYDSRNCPGEIPPCATQDCRVGNWSDWSACSGDGGRLDCGEGFAVRFRDIVTPPSGIGAKPCEQLVTFARCTKTQCASGCRLGEWGAWSPCSKECTGTDGTPGMRWRERTVTSGTPGSTPCNSPLHNTMAYEEQPCNTHACGQNCILGDWERFGHCSRECGGGQQLWIRRIVQPGQGNGIPCPEATSRQRHEYRVCNLHRCPSEEEGGDDSAPQESPAEEQLTEVPKDDEQGRQVSEPGGTVVDPRAQQGTPDGGAAEIGDQAREQSQSAGAQPFPVWMLAGLGALAVVALYFAVKGDRQAPKGDRQAPKGDRQAPTKPFPTR